MPRKRTSWTRLCGAVIAALLAGGISLAACGERAADDDAPEAAAPAGESSEASAGETRTWRNDPSVLAGQKAANYVPFTFDYPAGWSVVEDGTQPDSDSPNFVKVENATADNITIENFAVGWYSGTGAEEVIAMIEPQFAASFPNYVKVGDRTWTVDGISSPGFVFQARVEAPSGPVQFYGRALTVPVDATRGLVIVLFASNLAEGVEGPEDVGEEGQMPVILESFEIES